MTQQVQELIDKIKQEGVATAQKEAETITEKAREEAGRINKDAQSSTEQLLANAKVEVKKMQESSQMAVRQASRDMLLTLREGILKMLEAIVAKEVKDALTPEQLATIITDVVKNSAEADKADADIRVMLSAKDLKKLEEHFIAKLQKKIKGTLTFSGNQDIEKGFTVSYDAGKSSFDFTDESLAQFLSQYVNDQVAQLLKESVQ